MPTGFDVEGARKSGYNDDEILSHLTESRKFDIDGAVKAGYSKADIIKHLSQTTASAAANTPVAARNTVSIPLRNASGTMTPKGLDEPMGGPAVAITSPLRLMSSGAEQTGRGMTRMAHPESGSDFAGGVSDTARGLGVLTLPFTGPGMLAKPMASAVGLTSGAVVGGLTEVLTKLMGSPKGYAELVGTLAGGAAGAATARGAQLLGQLTKDIPELPNLLQEARTNPKLRAALLKRIPLVGKSLFDITEARKPEPYKPAFTKGKAPNMPDYGGPAKPELQTGTRLPVKRWTPPEQPTPEPVKFVKGKAPNMPSYGGPATTELQTGTRLPVKRWTPPVQEPAKPFTFTKGKQANMPGYGGPATTELQTGTRLPVRRWTPPEVEPEPEPDPAKPFKPNPAIRRLVRSGGRVSKSSGMPSGGGGGVRRGINRAIMTPAEVEQVQTPKAPGGDPSGHPGGPRYDEIQKQAGEQHVSETHDKDTTVARVLKSKGITPSKWKDLTHAEKSAYVEAAGEGKTARNKYDPLPKPGAKPIRRRARAFEQIDTDIYNMLVKTWGAEL